MRVEALRIAGEKIGSDRDGDRQIGIHNPFTHELVGTVPKATLAEVQRAFEIAKSTWWSRRRAPGPMAIRPTPRSRWAR